MESLESNTPTPEPENTKINTIKAPHYKRPSKAMNLIGSASIIITSILAPRGVMAQDTTPPTAQQEKYKSEFEILQEKSAYIKEVIEKYLEQHPEEEHIQERYAMEAHNLLFSLYVNGLNKIENPENATKLISFMVDDRKVAENDPEYGMRAKKRPIAYAGPARTFWRLRQNYPYYHKDETETYPFENGEINAISMALDSAKTADDFFGTLSNEFYKKYGDEPYVYYDPHVLKGSKMTPEERFQAGQWDLLNGLPSYEVTNLERTQNGFNPKFKFGESLNL